MILKQITLSNFGPFAEGTAVDIEPDVTVITGPNDVGKTFALRAIEVLCSDQSIAAHEVNEDRIREFRGKWTTDKEICCKAVFETTGSDHSLRGLPRGTKPHSLVTVERVLTENGGQVREILSGSVRSNLEIPLRNAPAVVKLPPASEVRQELNLHELTEAESQLLRLGFGSGFTVAQHTSIDPRTRSFRITNAERHLNDKLAQIFPSTMSLRFRLIEIGSNPEHLGIGLIDQHGGFTMLGSRGAGVRKLLNVMGTLLRVNPAEGHTIVVYDEPETSLHSDAQHMLRRLLEGLAVHSGVQVIYTTHSSAMINTCRPHALRVLKRERRDEKAVSVFVKNPSRENYTLIRSSMGITPADSLLYAPVTVIVEGSTEVHCIPVVLEKLVNAGVIPRDQLENVLSMTHFLDGEGCSFEYMCRLAKSQNAKPIVFLDGDKATEIQKIHAKHPEIPVIDLPSKTEFEQIVPCRIYLQAVARLLEDTTGNVCEEAFQSWEERAQPRQSVLFSKRVEQWLRDEFDIGIRKPSAMREALINAEVTDVVTAPFVKLFDTMVKVAGTF